MKTVFVAIIGLVVAASGAAQTPAGQEIEIIRNGSHSAAQAPAQNFTGAVQVDQVFPAKGRSRVSGGVVTFQPGARSAWHTHPLGQILIVTEGVGRVQAWGGPIQEIRAGDVVRIPPRVKHWHGASPTTAMTHMAIQEALDGDAVDWLEKVSDTQYAGVNQMLNTMPIPPVDLRAVSPALDQYTQSRLLGDLWKRPYLSPRDRSIVTLAALIARDQTVQMDYYLNLALDNGVKPGEISEIIAHLAFYSGWANAVSAVGIAKDVFHKRGIGADQLPPASVELLPLNEAAEKQRATSVEQNFGAVAPGLVQYTTDVLFRDLWLRPGLAPRDRSLVTVSALIASGQVAQVSYHLNRAMDNGLTQREASEVLTHLAFYAGWPNVFSALPVAKEVFEKRAK